MIAIYLELQVGYFLGELGHALRVLGVAYLGHQQILPQLALQLSKLSLRLSETLCNCQKYSSFTAAVCNVVAGDGYLS